MCILKNLQILAIEIFKSKNRISSEIMDDIFHFVEKPYGIRNSSILQGKRVNHKYKHVNVSAPKI